MNAILNRGFVSPYIQFQFAAGEIDTVPPRYFMSFHQERSVEQACSFTLTIMYAPGKYDDDTASTMHKLLLSSVKKDVSYRYGYKTEHGGLSLQNKCYRGIFTTYTEDIQEGYLTYTISGFAKCIELASPSVCVNDYLTELKKNTELIKPSDVVEQLVTGDNYGTGIAEYFSNYEIHIDHQDKMIQTSSIHIQDGPLHDVFFGTIKSDGSALPDGLVNLSYIENTTEDILNSGLLSQSQYYRYTELIRNVYDSYHIKDYEWDAMMDAKNAVQNLKKIPYVCYFDNAVSGMDSSSHGSFYYLPKYTKQITNVFNYNFGNKFIDSDVLNFTVSLDCTSAIATVGALQEITADIDVDGEAIGANYNATQADGFTHNTFNTASGFNESAFISTTTLASALNFPFEATMTVVGQLDTNQLLDCIRVNVFVNGKEHVGLSGDYSILGIEDDLSQDGFTTTFKLVKSAWGVSNDKLTSYNTNYNAGNKVWYNQQALMSDFN